MEISDLAGISQPLTKLIDVVSSGMGALYRPLGIRREAKAQAEAIKLLGHANTDVDIVRAKALAATDASNKILLSDANATIERRVQARVAHRELIRQTNLEKIADAAASHMADQASEQPVDEDWKARFFKIAEDVSNSDMQDLWGRVLAGEVAQPGKYSLRSLDTLRNLSRAEAEAFRHLRYLATDDGYVYKVGDTDELAAFGVNFRHLLDLRAAGILADGDMLTATYTPKEGFTFIANRFNGKILLFEFADLVRNEGVVLECFALTRVGIELLSLVEPSPNRQYVDKLAKKYKGHYVVMMGEVGQPKELFETFE